MLKLKSELLTNNDVKWYFPKPGNPNYMYKST